PLGIRDEWAAWGRRAGRDKGRWSMSWPHPGERARPLRPGFPVSLAGRSVVRWPGVRLSLPGRAVFLLGSGGPPRRPNPDRLLLWHHAPCEFFLLRGSVADLLGWYVRVSL